MARIYYRSVFDELNDMREYMDTLFRQMAEPPGTALLPATGEPAKMLPAATSNLRVDVSEQDDEVIVTADMIAGVTKKDITIDLINPQALEIACERREETKEENEGYYLQERTFGSMTRIVPLPKPVMEGGAKASLKNGILEIHLKKVTREPVTKIIIE
nr:Hsp20/alpha crystallin family protein [uncultured Methanoregula sp.]